MATEIKPGQVWAWEYRTRDPFTIESLEGDNVWYSYEADRAGTYSSSQQSIRERADLVKDVDATPAPLDPSKKADALDLISRGFAALAQAVRDGA